MALHLIDPDGDVVLLLRRGTELQLDGELYEPLSPLSLSYTRETAAAFRYGTSKSVVTKQSSLFRLQLEPRPVPFIKGARSDKHAKIPDQTAVGIANKSMRIQVSSKHLMLASAYFKRSLGSKLEEGHTLRSQGYMEISMDGQQPEAMLIVMNIIHGRTRQVPFSIDVDMLTRIAVLVDYLECHEAVEPYACRWVGNLERYIPRNYSRELVQWICISLVFDEKELVEEITRTALLQAKRPVATLDLPIRDSFTGPNPD